jgi:glycosyltransferase involved in cell wall biosynthesis
LTFKSAVPAPLATYCAASPHPPHIVFGITNAQTCLNLTGRLRALRQAGFRVTLISSPGNQLDEIAEVEGIEAIRVPIRREMAPFADLVSLVKLWLVLRQLRPDVTEFGTPKAGLLGNLASMLVSVPARVYMLRGLKLETAGGLKRSILLAAEKVSAACAHVVLSNSASMQAGAVALRIAPAAKIKMLGSGSSNGVDVRRFCPGPSDVRAAMNIPADAPVLGFVGRMTKDKGIPELIAAFDTILKAEPDARLLLVGWFDKAEDALGPELRAHIDRHANIICTGFVQDTAPYFRAMDLMVLPTWREGFPNVVLEAAATGIPVITTESTGSRDSVLPEVTGLLIPPGYPDAISEACLKLIKNHELRRQMGRAARDWVCQRFSDERVLRLAVNFYKGLLEQSHKQSHHGYTH